MRRGTLKVCGVVSGEELERLRRGGATHAGLWWGMDDRSSLSLAQLRALPRHPDLARGIVTLSPDAEGIAQAARAAEASFVQLHAFPLPGFLTDLRGRLPEDCRIVKVLHLDGDTLLEARFLEAYERAGVDLFLIDTMVAGRVGSTGRRAPLPAVRAASARLRRPFLLAGGLDDASAPEYAQLREDPRWYGIDVDSSARDARGRIRGDRIAALARAWACGARAAGAS